MNIIIEGPEASGKTTLAKTIMDRYPYFEYNHATSTTPNDYKYHKELMNYPESIDKILKLELTNLINSVRKKESAFSNGTVEHYCGLYSRLKRKKMKHIKQKK